MNLAQSKCKVRVKWAIAIATLHTYDHSPTLTIYLKINHSCKKE